MTGTLRAIYKYWAGILLLGLIVQIFLAGFGVFDVVGAAEEGSATSDDVDDSFSAHAGLGHLLWFGMILLFLLSLAARLGRNRVLLTLALPVLGFVQILLAAAGEDAPGVGALHPLNGILILGLTGWLVYQAFRRWTDLGASGQRYAAAPPAT